MPLPTTYDPDTIEYRLTTEGDVSPPAITATLSAGALGPDALQTFAAGYDAAFQAFGEVLLGVAGVTAVHVYKTYTGSLAPTDIFVP